MVKAIIFDLDNTLIDFMRMKKISCEAAIDAMLDAGLKMKKDEALEELYKIYFEEGLEDKHIFQKFLGRNDYKILASAIVSYRKTRTGFLRPYPGTKSTLIKLKERGYKLAIVSDAPTLKAWIRLVSMGIEHLFDVVVALDETGEEKPSSMPFKAALKELNVYAQDCLMVGDKPEKDIAGARNLGMKTAFAKYGSDKRFCVECDYVLESVSDLVELAENTAGQR